MVVKLETVENEIDRIEKGKDKRFDPTTFISDCYKDCRIKKRMTADKIVKDYDLVHMFR